MSQTRQLELTHVRMDAPADGPVRIAGTAVPYGHDITYQGQVERFAPGAIDAAAVVGRPLMWGHNYTDPAAWLGSITDADNTDGGLLVEAEVVDVATAAKLRAAATPPGLSVGVTIDHATHEDDQSVTYHAATLRELSITTIPAYGDQSMIAAVRHDMEQENPAVPDTPTPPDPVDLDQFVRRADLDALAERINQRLDPSPPPTPITPAQVRAGFVQHVIDFGRDRTATRADMLSADNTGLTDPARTSTVLLDTFDGMRYLLPNVARLPFPESGIVHHLPKKTQHTQVGLRAGEKQAPTSRALQTGVDPFTGEWFDSYLDIAYELIRTSTPGAVQVAVDDMLSQYATTTDLGVTENVEAAATASGAAIDFTSYKTMLGSLRAGITAVRAACGPNVVPKVALTPASFDEVLALTDGDGRRVLATVGPSNADSGGATLLARSVTIAGLLLFENPQATVDVMFSDVSLQVSELPPLQVSADVPSKLGRDVALLGNIITIDRVPAGIIKFSA